MPQFDMPLDQLEQYRPDRAEPADFDEFWRRTLDEQDETHPLAVERDAVDHGLRQIVTDDVTFTGFGGQPVRAWFHRPAGTVEPLACVVTYIGYGGGRGLSHQNTLLAQAGYGVLVMDNRGQGAGSPTTVGHTADASTTGPHAPGFLTQGIEDPDRYYYRRLFTDAARAVVVARGLPEVDAGRVMVSGGSQGGALALAAAALSELRDVPLRAAIVDVPFLTHVRRATQITDAHPYAELVRYLHARRDRVEQSFRTLSYFDGVSMAARVTVPGLFSVGLCDPICPPSCVYAAYHHYAGEKEIKVYAYNGHEHGGPFQEVEHVRFAHRVLA